VHPNRLGRGLPLQRPAGASSAGPWRARGEGNQSHWERDFNHAQRLRPAMKPTARDPPWPAHCSEQRKGAEARRGRSRVAPQGSQRAARRRRGSAPSPGRLRGPAQEQQGNRHTKQGRRSNRMTQAGENSAGGARHPEDGKPRSRHPGLSSKPPSCEPAPGPARPGARARGPVPGRVPARPVQANMDRRKPGTSPPKDRARVRARLGPGPAGGPARKAKGGVRGSAAEGGRGRAEEKKTKNCLRPHEAHQQHCGKKVSTTSVPEIQTTKGPAAN
jgi:hypothetical protein